MRIHGILARLTAGALLLGGPVALQAAPKPAASQAPKPVYGGFGFDTAGMDRTAAPGNDWVRYCSGTYLKDLVIPSDRSNFGMFTKLRDLSQQQTRSIVEGAASQEHPKPGSEAQKVGDYFSSFLDEAGIEAKGLAPIQPQLEAIAALGDRAALCRAMGQALRQGVRVPLGVDPAQDLKDPSRYTVYLNQSGLGLPDRDYYLEPKFAPVREKYEIHIASLLRLAGIPQAETKAKGILALETRMAQVHWTKVEERQIEKQYNPVKRAGLDEAYPGFDWTALLGGLGLQPLDTLVVANPSAIAGTGKLIAEAPLETWKDYLTFHTLKAAAPFLPKAFVQEDFAFSGTVLSGQPEIQPRWKRGVDLAAAALGEAVGKLYVEKYFPPSAKAQADQLVKFIIKAMDQRLSRLTWMDPKTKAEARAKLACFTPKIGYPDRWRDYSSLEIKRGDALGNAQRAAAFAFQRSLDKIGKPIDRSEWSMAPMTVNAYANPLWNEIVFPAAILQPPFFDPQADAAVNYGAIGVVIGHEISHHFDDQGRKFDKEGKLADWWTPEDVTRFGALTDKVVQQYAAYEPLPGVHVNGQLTLGENIADLAGLNVALDAYHQSLKGKAAKKIGGFTGDQRFFLGFAQVWRQKYRDEALLNQITTNEHTPGHLRPNVVRNLDAWYSAFGVKPGQALYLAPADRIKLW